MKIPALESKTPITVRVTEDNVACGIRGDKKNCALGLAFQTSLGDAIEGVEAGLRRTTIITHGGGRVVFTTPPKYAAIMRQFDLTGEFPPGEYTFLPLRQSDSRAYQVVMSRKYRKPGYVPAKGGRTAAVRRLPTR